MQSKVLLGNSLSQELYIQEFITKHSIPEYAITKLTEGVKIEDVHLLIRQYKVHVGISEKRVIIFAGTVTIPAQNALLKFLEELPTSDYVFFCVETEGLLLETIRSRCNILFLSGKKENPIIDTDEVYSALPILAQSITSSDEYYVLVKKIREVVLEVVKQKKYDKYYQLFPLLLYLNKQTQYIRENNVSPQFTVESAQYFDDVRVL
jgi:DNA polymerase-3 subunit delta'